MEGKEEAGERRPVSDRVWMGVGEVKGGHEQARLLQRQREGKGGMG